MNNERFLYHRVHREHGEGRKTDYVLSIERFFIVAFRSAKAAYSQLSRSDRRHLFSARCLVHRQFLRDLRGDTCDSSSYRNHYVLRPAQQPDFFQKRCLQFLQKFQIFDFAMVFVHHIKDVHHLINIRGDACQVDRQAKIE